MKTAAFPLILSESGVTAKIRKAEQIKNGNTYTFYILEYILLGKRKQEWHSELAAAKRAASDACRKIANGDQLSLELRQGDRLTYLRATEALEKTHFPLDSACREFADALGILNGLGSLAEAARFFVKAHNVQLPRVNVGQAVDEMIAQATRDGKSEERVHQLESYLNRFKAAFNCNLTELTSKLVSEFLSSMKVKERTKKNCRDVLNAFFRWCVGAGYLPKGQDLMEHVQKYGGRKTGEIQIFTPEELRKLIAAADERLLPYLVIQAFAGIRGREIQRLDWSDIDLEDGFIEISSEAAKTDVRRLVPIKPNLKAWLLPLAKKSGAVCPFKNLANQLSDLAADAEVKWKKNALRHSYISYRVAECADVPRVADESGNSPAVIRTNYLRRVKPPQAAEWFGILPAPAEELKAAA
jgi:integrase